MFYSGFKIRQCLDCALLRISQEDPLLWRELALSMLTLVFYYFVAMKELGFFLKLSYKRHKKSKMTSFFKHVTSMNIHYGEELFFSQNKADVILYSSYFQQIPWKDQNQNCLGRSSLLDFLNRLWLSSLHLPVGSTKDVNL